MTKEQLIKRLIEMRRTGADETLDRVCESSTGCEDCPLYSTGRLCSHQTIDYLLDHIIDHETHQETNLEHYISSYHLYEEGDDGSIGIDEEATMAIREMNSLKDIAKWLLEPYEEPKPKYKLTQFEYDVLDSYDCLDKGMRFDGYYPLMAMKEKGYFKGIPEDANIFDIVNNAEVIDSE